jgi:hypothetical protein
MQFIAKLRKFILALQPRVATIALVPAAGLLAQGCGTAGQADAVQAVVSDGQLILDEVTTGPGGGAACLGDAVAASVAELGWDLVVQALGNLGNTFGAGKFEVKADLATYNHWRRVLRVNVPLPNTFQPYVKWRRRPDIPGPGSEPTPSQAETWNGITQGTGKARTRITYITRLFWIKAII